MGCESIKGVTYSKESMAMKGYLNREPETWVRVNQAENGRFLRGKVGNPRWRKPMCSKAPKWADTALHVDGLRCLKGHGVKWGWETGKTRCCVTCGLCHSPSQQQTESLETKEFMGILSCNPGIVIRIYSEAAGENGTQLVKGYYKNY